MIHNLKEDDDACLLDKLVVNIFKDTVHFKMLNAIPKPKAYDSSRFYRFHDLVS